MSGRTTRDTNPGLQPFGYKGALSDPVAEGAGLVWMSVRAYQPSLARFATPEPEGLAAVWNDPDVLAGDPINLIDVDGALSVREHRFLTSVGNGMSDAVVGMASLAGIAVGGLNGGQAANNALGGFTNAGTKVNNWGGHPEWNPCPGLADTAGNLTGGLLAGAGIGAAGGVIAGEAAGESVAGTAGRVPGDPPGFIGPGGNSKMPADWRTSPNRSGTGQRYWNSEENPSEAVTTFGSRPTSNTAFMCIRLRADDP